MGGMEETMLKYLGKGDIIFLGIPLSTCTRRPGQDIKFIFHTFFVSRKQTKNPGRGGGYFLIIG